MVWLFLLHAAFATEVPCARRWLEHDFKHPKFDPSRVSAFRELILDATSSQSGHLPPVILRQPEAWIALFDVAAFPDAGAQRALTPKEQRRIYRVLRAYRTRKPMAESRAERWFNDLWLAAKGEPWNKTPAATAQQLWIDDHFNRTLALLRLKDHLRALGFSKDPSILERFKKFRARHSFLEDRILSVLSMLIWNAFSGHPVPLRLPRGRLDSITEREVRHLVQSLGPEGARKVLHKKYGQLAQDSLQWNRISRSYGRLARIYVAGFLLSYPALRHFLSSVWISEDDKRNFEADTFDRKMALDLQLQSWIESESVLGDPPTPAAIDQKRKELESLTDDQLRAFK